MPIMPSGPRTGIGRRLVHMGTVEQNRDRFLQEVDESITREMERSLYVQSGIFGDSPKRALKLLPHSGTS